MKKQYFKFISISKAIDLTRNLCVCVEFFLSLQYVIMSEWRFGQMLPQRPLVTIALLLKGFIKRKKIKTNLF